MIARSPCLDQGSETPCRQTLGSQWWFALSLLAAPWMITVLCFRQLLPRQPLAGLALLPGLAAASLLLHHVHRHLERNHRPGEEGRPFPTLGAANWITLLRGSAIIALAGLLPCALPATGGLHGLLSWAPGLIYLAAAMADLLDGVVARGSGRVTELGRTLDTATDAAGLLIASLLAVALGRLPVPYLLAGIAYYPFVFGVWFRRRRGLAVSALVLRPYSRIIAGFHMALVGVALLPLIAPRYLAIAAYLFMTPLLFGFVRDWLVVSGRLRTDSCQRTAWDQWAALLWTSVLPPLLRLFLLGALISAFLGHCPAFLRLDVVVLALLTGSGLLGRLAGLALALIIATTLGEPGLLALLLFGAGLGLALTGSGVCSLWSPEEAILYRGQGSKTPSPRQAGTEKSP